MKAFLGRRNDQSRMSIAEWNSSATVITSHLSPYTRPLVSFRSLNRSPFLFSFFPDFMRCLFFFGPHSPQLVLGLHNLRKYESKTRKMAGREVVLKPPDCVTGSLFGIRNRNADQHIDGYHNKHIHRYRDGRCVRGGYRQVGARAQENPTRDIFFKKQVWTEDWNEACIMGKQEGYSHFTKGRPQLVIAGRTGRLTGNCLDFCLSFFFSLFSFLVFFPFFLSHQ